MKQFIFILILSGICSGALAQINVQLLHQLVAESKSENQQQKATRDNQGLVTAAEQLNKTQLQRLNVQYRKLQQRFAVITLAIDAAQISLQGAPIVAEIARQQQLIYEQAYHNPLLIPLAFNAEKNMLERASSLMAYLQGLVISMGDIKQMSPSDRRMLFGFVISELRGIAGAARGLAASMRYGAAGRSADPFGGFINQDRQLVEQVMRRSKLLSDQL